MKILEEKVVSPSILAVKLENGKWYALANDHYNGEYWSSYELEDGSYYGYIPGTECELVPEFNMIDKKNKRI